MTQTEHIFHLVYDYLCGDDTNVIRVKGNYKDLANRFEEWLKENNHNIERRLNNDKNAIWFIFSKDSEDSVCICDHEKYPTIKHQDICIECYNEFDY